jgi:hypothetical protein
MTPPNIMSGLTRTGAYQFNDDVIPVSAFASSDLTFFQLSEKREQEAESDEDSNSEFCVSSVVNEETPRDSSDLVNQVSQKY